MKTIVSRTCHYFSATLCAGMLLFVAAGAPAQNLFEVDVISGNIYEFATNGTPTTFYSGIQNGSWSMAFDRSGNLFVASSTNILKINPAGITNVFATGIFPEDLAFNCAGDLFVSDDLSNNIYEYAPDGMKSTFVSGLNRPGGLAFDRAGNLFVADQGSNHIFEFTTNGAQSIFASNIDFCLGLAFDGAGNLFEADYLSGHIYKFSTNGAPSTFASGLDGPVGLVFNAAGDLFEADSLSHTIFEFAPDGTQTTFYSNFDEPPFSEPTALAFQPITQLTPAPCSNAFQFTVSMPSPYFSAIIEASTNLVNWTAAYTNTPPFAYTDTTAKVNYRFYRAQVAQ